MNKLIAIERKEKKRRPEKRAQKPSAAPIRKCGLLKSLLISTFKVDKVCLLSKDQKGDDKLIMKYLDWRGNMVLTKVIFYHGSYETKVIRYEATPNK